MTNETTTQTENRIESAEPVKPDLVQDVSPFKKNTFVDLAKVDIRQFLEKKGGFSYLSWAHAVDFLYRKYPDAIINVKKFPDPTQGGALVPFYRALNGYFVEVDVIINGISRCEPFAVTNNKNYPIDKPTVADINNSIQRAKVKMIAMHGLGLHVYAGEDFPKSFEDNLPEVYQQHPQQQQFHQHGYEEQPQQGYQQQPPHVEASTPVMTDMQKTTLRELAQHISVLQNPQGAAQQQINDTVRAVYTHHQLTATLTPAQADEKIEELRQVLKTIQDNRMVDQGQDPSFSFPPVQ